MKKYFILIFVILVLSSSYSFSATTAAASGSITDNENVFGQADDDSNKGSIARLSTGVTLYFNTSENAYAIITKHTSGPLAYGTAADTTDVYRTSDEFGTPAAPENSDSSEFDDWNSM